MNEQITAEELAADLKSALDRVRRGEVLTVTEDGHPVATMTSTDDPPWLIRHDPALRLSDFVPGAPLKIKGIDAVEILIAERDYERSGKKYR